MLKYFDKKQKGFTLIELLVVIAIIGVLATIVMTNVSTARNKAKDTSIKGNLNSLRAGGGIYYENNNSYSGVCAGSPDFTKANAAISTQGGDWLCFATAGVGGRWCAQSKLVAVTGTTWCVDADGNTGGSLVACDATAANCN